MQYSSMAKKCQNKMIINSTDTFLDKIMKAL